MLRMLWNVAVLSSVNQLSFSTKVLIDYHGDDDNPSTIIQAKRREDNDSSAFDELGQLGDELDFLQTGDITLTQNQTKRLKGANKQSQELQRIQYDTRGKKYSYCEAEVPDDDHYICELRHLESFISFCLSVCLPPFPFFPLLILIS